MLSFLKITNLAILEDVSMEPGPGLNVLTGETGAGKSIVVDAIGLLVGERGSADLIRSGCDRLVVEAQFDLPHSKELAAGLREAGLGDEEARGEIVIRRELILQDGSARGRALINGRIVPLAALKLLGDLLADMHGQHQHQSLLRADGQRDALDRFAGVLPLRDQVAALHARLKELERERDDLAGREQERARREDTLRHQIAEIQAVMPREDEEADLAREEGLLRHASEVGRLAGESFALLSDDDDSVLARLGGAADRVARLSAIDPHAGKLGDLIREATMAASEAARGLSIYQDGENFDPSRLEQVAARLAELDRLRRKYGRSIGEVLRYLDEARGELEDLGASASRLGEIEELLRGTRDAYLGAARDLSARRTLAAGRMEKAVSKELRGLAMAGARLKIEVEPDAQGSGSSHGIDRIEFVLQPNDGEEPRALSRIASGGELSRLMLAVRNASEAAADHRTLVFDEVDSGIGGRVAETVGQRLSALARRQQVLCVTHLPQIAAFADRHFLVTKTSEGGRTRASLGPLSDDARVMEVARMLGGEPPDTARRHAAALLDSVGGRAEDRGRARA